MVSVAVIGCGIVGATIAYELSRLPQFAVTVFDQQFPAQQASGAALGVLMGAISGKTKGRAWEWRRTSLERYETLIPELEAATGNPIPWNREGILRLCFAGEDLSSWEHLVEQRRSQGWPLEILSAAEVRSRYPYLSPQGIIAAIYSPRDRQVNPVALTQALVAAAEKNGAQFHFNTPVQGFETCPAPTSLEDSIASKTQQVEALQTAKGLLAVDWVAIAAGLGSTPLTAALQQTVDIRPVLGQAMRLRLPAPLAETLQPAITGDDVYLVPLGGSDYWVGATVEFPNRDASKPIDPQADPQRLTALHQRAIDYCPVLREATILEQWSGLRPRPEGRPAPIVEQLSQYTNVILASGHYRNGVLLAPATARAVQALLPCKE